MNIDELSKLIKSIADLLSVLVWPLLIFFILIRFAPALREFFNGLAELSFKGGGFEATAKRQQIEATAALVAASVNREEDKKASPETTSQKAKEIAKVIENTINNRSIRRTHNANVLWVDDRPNNNIFERQSLEAVGISFTLATTTEEALDKIAQQRFDVIISDMGRPPDAQAGYTLLDQLRMSNNKTPYVIYASSNASEHKAEARRRGAIGSTNRATELFGYVVSSINNQTKS